MFITSRLLKLHNVFFTSRFSFAQHITSQSERYIDRLGGRVIPRLIVSQSSSMQFGTSILDPCWNCGRIQRESKFFCHNCKVLQKPESNYNFFHLLDVKQTFDINNNELVRKFRQLQAILHPDKFSNSSDNEKEYSADLSAHVNKAFQTLSDPLERGLYILNLNGLYVQEENTTLNKAFLLQVMELNEELESIDSIDEVNEFHNKNKTTISSIVEKISKSFADQDINSARTALMEMKYFTTLEVKIKEKILQLGSH